MIAAFVIAAALTHLTTEHLVNPIGMDEQKPRFSWRAEDVGAAAQSARRIVVTAPDGATVWDSGLVPGDVSTCVPYTGSALKPFTRYAWRVEADFGGKTVASSENAWFETGFLDGAWKHSSWISAMSGQGAFRPPMRLARAFTVTKPLKRARLYATALGLYKPFVNGQAITDDRLLPGWTSYAHHVPYEAFDVTAQIREGTNALAALVGDGWFAGCISRVAKPAGTFGHGRETPLFRAELRLEYADGSVETVGTDKTWSSFYLCPAMLAADMYQGESYDAAIDDMSWKLPGFEKLAYKSDVSVEDYPTQIVWHDGARVRVRRTIRPVSVRKRPGHVWQLDFGENVAGVERITLKKAYPGAVITVRHGEWLDRDGDLWRVNLAFAQATTTLACGKEPLVYAPSFTSYGFRYIELSGWPEDSVAPDAVVVEVLSSTGAPTASFRCSDETLNRFVANVRRSQEANFIDVPTDCPQRCERFGWTGDAQVFAETAMLSYDVAAFFTKWNHDLQNDFRRDGSYGDISPWPRGPAEEADVAGATSWNNPLKKPRARLRPSAGWSDVGVVIPWTVYRTYGDRRILERSYECMLAYARSYGEGAATIGDHLNLDDATDKAFVVAAMDVHVLTLVRHAAVALGKMKDVEIVDAILLKRRDAIAARWFTPEGDLKEKSQTSAAMTVLYGLAPNEAAAKKAAAELVRRIHAKDDHLSTGFLGTPILLQALERAGETELAYKLLLTKTFPSWLYPVTQGATTVWERWDAIRDGTFHKDWMNSLNHYAYGSVVSWLYGTICGIRNLSEEDPAAAGFKRFRLAPVPGGGLTEAEASFDSPYGTIRSAWKTENGKTTYRFTVPANTTAEIVLLGAKPRTVGPGDYTF